MSDRRTWQRDVLALMAGESLVIEPDGSSQVSEPLTLVPVPARNYASDNECEEHFLEVFGEAVRCRMRTLESPAVMMSGGLDTAGIIAMMGRLLPELGGQSINSYSAIDDDVESSLESRSIQSMAGLPGIRAHFVSVPSFTGMVSLDDLVNAAWLRAHPVDNSVLIPALMYLAASRNGDRVMLHGASGDVTLSTPMRYAANYLRRGQLLRVWRECQAASDHHVYLRGTSPTRNFLLNVSRAFVPAGLKRPIHGLRRGRKLQLDKSVINPDFAASICLQERLEDQAGKGLHAGVANDDSINSERTRQFIRSTLSISARVAARVGVEARDPWADRRVVEFFLGLPVEQKVRNGWTKHLLRTAFQGDLAHEVLWRHDKEHLGWKCTERLMMESETVIKKLFNDDLGVIEQFVDTVAAKALYALYIDSKDILTRDKIFELATLIMWMNRVKSSNFEQTTY